MMRGVNLQKRPPKPRSSGGAIVVEVSNRQRRRIDSHRLAQAIRIALEGEGIRRGNVSLAIVDSPTIHQINRQFLDHDEPTDVISFLLENGRGFVDGEIVASADAAAKAAPQFGWPASAELLLYVLHGALHLAGYDDRRPADRRQMRQAEAKYLARFKLKSPVDRQSRSNRKRRSEDDT